MIKAWAFYRRSTDKQELSIEDQSAACKEYALANGWVIVQEFKPLKGHGSGLTIDRDPEFLRMISVGRARTHGAKFLVVYDVSRFGRLLPKDKFYFEQVLARECGLQVRYA